MRLGSRPKACSSSSRKFQLVFNHFTQEELPKTKTRHETTVVNDEGERVLKGWKERGKQ
jgi:hypothetical protein